jgi:GAF domain-containing protein
MEQKVLATLLGGSISHREESHLVLLKSIADATRSACAAKACSVQSFDPQTYELVFEAVSGHGDPDLVGRRYSAGAGIAGWTFNSQQSSVVDDIETDPKFAKDFAESTGYIPHSIISFPLAHSDQQLGVLQILDAALGARTQLDTITFLSLFADQASIALWLLERDRLVNTAVGSSSPGLRELIAVSTALSSVNDVKRSNALGLLHALRQILLADS